MSATCIRRMVVSFGLVIAVLAIAAGRTDARPLYKKAFDEVYSEELKGKPVTCAVCHPGDNKRDLNRYGQALEKELGEKNVRDLERIKAAIRAIEPVVRGEIATADKAFFTE